MSGTWTHQRLLRFCRTHILYSRLTLNILTRKTWSPIIEWEGIIFLFKCQTDNFHTWPSECARLLSSYTFSPTAACQHVVQANHLHTPITQHAVCNGLYWSSWASLSFQNHPTSCHSTFGENAVHPVSQKQTALLRTETRNQDAATLTLMEAGLHFYGRVRVRVRVSKEFPRSSSAYFFGY